MRGRNGVDVDLLPVVLVGLPGAGKTSVGRHLATALNVTVIDSDSEVKRRARATIPELFARVGEAGFRELEYRAIEHCLSLAQGIVALGGGAVTHERTRELLRRYTVVYLRTSVDEVVRRLDAHTGRPLIDGDVASKVAALDAQRRKLYEEVADITVDTDGADVAEIARRVHLGLAQYARAAAAAQVQPVHIDVGPAPGYKVTIGAGVSQELAGLLPARARRVFVLHPPAMTGAVELLRQYVGPRELISYCHPDGEAAKTFGVAQQCWELLGKHHFSRADLVIGLGGGATTDLAGFVASTWLRGVDVIQIPTTLLGMVDAAVGGKTGINTRTGKNLVGTFYPPLAVLADTDRLQTLPSATLVAGSAEIVKCGWIRDPKILALIHENGPLSVEHPHLQKLIERAVAVKAQVVSADLRESGLREILNYGHTAAHAIEKLSDYQVSHGEAVAVGMLFATHVGISLGIVDAQLLARQTAYLQELGLPIRWPNAHPASAAIAVMQSDKKVRDDAIRMVFVTGPGKSTVRAVSDESAFQAAWDYISAPVEAAA